jgi:hypothetical protein
MEAENITRLGLMHAQSTGIRHKGQSIGRNTQSGTMGSAVKIVFWKEMSWVKLQKLWINFLGWYRFIHLPGYSRTLRRAGKQRWPSAFLSATVTRGSRQQTDYCQLNDRHGSSEINKHTHKIHAVIFDSKEWENDEPKHTICKHHSSCVCLSSDIEMSEYKFGETVLNW